MKACLTPAALILDMASVPARARAASACEPASTSFRDAVSEYLSSGTQGFIERFLRGSPLAGQIGPEGGQRLRQIEHVLGPLQGSSVISLKELGGRSCYLVAALEYASGPAFVIIMYYGNKDRVVPLSLRLGAEPDKAFSIPALITND